VPARGRPGPGDRMKASQPERFAEALRPRLMGPRLAAAVGGGPATCHVLDAKYEPGVRGVILYTHGQRLLRADLLDETTPPEPPVVVQADDHGLPVVPPGLRMSAFPHDPDLPSLPTVMNAPTLGRLLATAVNGRSGPVDVRAALRCRVELLRYRPGKRATVRVTRGAAATAHVAKVYHQPAKAAAVAQEAPVLATAAGVRRVLRLAPTVAYLPELSVVVQQAVRGVPLDQLLETGRGCAPSARGGVRTAARALAELHECPPAGTRQRSVERELERFGVRAERIATVDPRLGGAAAELANRLVDVHAQLPAAATGLVHGDCKPSQFLLQGSHAYLLDLDHLGISDQTADVGTFLTTLRQLATRNRLARRSPGTAGALSELATVFVETYLRARGEHRTRARIKWQEAAALERKALRAFARAPGSPVAGALVQEANRCLDELAGAA